LLSHQKGYNSLFYEPILMTLAARLENDMPKRKISKPDVLAGNKMAATAITAKSLNRYNSTIYQPISVKLETQTCAKMTCVA
jgi:hypothetical protein